MSEHEHRHCFCGLKQSIITGNTEAAKQVGKKALRVFISSTFKDTQAERNYLMQEVYPEIRSLCEENDIHFSVVDLRWGIRDQATNDHASTEICLSEIERCYRESISGPCFVFLSFNRYGWEPLPRTVEANELEAVIENIGTQEDRDLVLKYYRKDTNAIPEEYVLRPIYDPEYGIDRSTAKSSWWNMEPNLQRILKESVKSSKLKDDQKVKWTVSVTENEVRKGIVERKNNIRSSFMIIRDIYFSNEEQNEKDCNLTSDYYDAEQDKITRLREDVQKLGVQTMKFNVDWDRGGITEASHGDYLKLFGERFKKDIKIMIKDAISELPNFNKLTIELASHLSFCQDRANEFYGRSALLKEGANYFTKTDKEHSILVVHGLSGSGKTSLMSKLAMEAINIVREQYGETPVLVTRFCGTSLESCNSYLLMNNVFHQIAAAFNLKAKEMDWSYDDMVAIFKMILQCEYIQKPLLVFIDSLDQLSNDFQGRSNLQWLPERLLPNVFLVVSTTTDRGGCLSSLKTMSIPQTNYLEIKSLTPDDAVVIFDRWLAKAGRQLTEEQRQYILKTACDARDEKPTALRLRLLFDVAVKWTSYQKVPELPTTIRSLIDKYFAFLEEEHGFLFVSSMMALLDTSRRGLTEEDLLDILSCCPDVLESIMQYHKSPIQRIPQVVFIRLRNNLGSYMVERGVYGKLTLAWYHRQFWEAAHDRYVKEGCEKYAELLKKYFSGELNDTYPDRGISSQPLFWKSEEKDSYHFNRQKLNELPLAALRGLHPESAIDILCDIQFCAAKIEAGFGRDLIRDFKMASEKLDSDILSSYKGFITSEMHVLEDDPAMVIQQGMKAFRCATVFSDACSLLLNPKEAIPWDPSIEIKCMVERINLFEQTDDLNFMTLDDVQGRIDDLKFYGKNHLFSLCQGKIFIWDLQTGEVGKVVALEKWIYSFEFVQSFTERDTSSTDRGVDRSVDIAMSCKDGLIHIWRILFASEITVEFLLKWEASDEGIGLGPVDVIAAERILLAAGINFVDEEREQQDYHSEITIWDITHYEHGDIQPPTIVVSKPSPTLFPEHKNCLVMDVQFGFSDEYLMLVFQLSGTKIAVFFCSVNDLKVIVQIWSEVNSGVWNSYASIVDMFKDSANQTQVLVPYKESYALFLLKRNQNNNFEATFVCKFQHNMSLFYKERNWILDLNHYELCLFYDTHLGNMVNECADVIENGGGKTELQMQEFQETPGVALGRHGMLQGHSRKVRLATFHSNVIASGSSSGVIKLWDASQFIRGGARLQKKHVCPLVLCFVIPDGDFTITGCSCHLVAKDKYSGESISDIWDQTHPKKYSLLTEVGGGPMLFLEEDEEFTQLVHIMNLFEGEDVNAFEEIRLPKCGCSYESSVDESRRLVALVHKVEGSTKIFIARAEKKGLLDLPMKIKGAVYSASINAIFVNGSQLLQVGTCCENGTTVLCLWNFRDSVENFECAKEIPADGAVEGIYELKYVFLHYEDGETRVKTITFAGETEIMELAVVSVIEHVHYTAACYIPVNKSVVLGTESGTLEIRDILTLEATSTVVAHTRSISNIKITDDATYLITTSDDQTLRIWTSTDMDPVAIYFSGTAILAFDTFYGSTGNLFVNYGDVRGKFCVLEVKTQDKTWRSITWENCSEDDEEQESGGASEDEEEIVEGDEEEEGEGEEKCEVEERKEWNKDNERFRGKDKEDCEEGVEKEVGRCKGRYGVEHEKEEKYEEEKNEEEGEYKGSKEGNENSRWDRERDFRDQKQERDVYDREGEVARAEEAEEIKAAGAGGEAVVEREGGEAAGEGEAAEEGETAGEREAAIKGEAAGEIEAAIKGAAAGEREAAIRGAAAGERETAIKGEAAGERETAIKGAAAGERETAIKGAAAGERETAIKGAAAEEEEVARDEKAVEEGETVGERGAAS